MAARHELAGRFSHPRKAAGFSELGGAPSGDRGKPSVRAGAWGRGMGENLRNCKIVKTRYLHRMRGGPTCDEVDLELDYCPKCVPEETQDPFPTQSFKFFYMFSVAVKCVNCGTYYVPSPRLGVIVTIIYFLGVWINEYLAGITAYPFPA